MLDYFLDFAAILLVLWLPLSAYWLVWLWLRVNHVEEALLLRPTHQQLQAEVKALRADIRVSIQDHVLATHPADGSIPPSRVWVAQYCIDLIRNHKKACHHLLTKKRK